MEGLVTPGQERVELREFEDPTPGAGQVVIDVKASSICGSDIHYIYREQQWDGPAGYWGVIAGHESAGEIVAVGPDVTSLKVGDRISNYHIAGCGHCDQCRMGYMIGCTAPERRAYGYQRDGGHADFQLVEQSTAIKLADSLTYLDGALTSCGWGTAYEALLRVNLSGRDRVFVAGLGPVGLAICLLAKKMGAPLVIGSDVSPERRDLALRLGAIDIALDARTDVPAQVADITAGLKCQVALDASGTAAGRSAAIQSTADWGRVGLVGAGGGLEVVVDEQLMFHQITVYSSWVTSLQHHAELIRLLDLWELHPDMTVVNKFSLENGADAYVAAADGRPGKTAIVME